MHMIIDTRRQLLGFEAAWKWYMTGCGGDSSTLYDLAPSGRSLGYQIGLATPGPRGCTKA